jgi:hypothetical protein
VGCCFGGDIRMSETRWNSWPADLEIPQRGQTWREHTGDEWQIVAVKPTPSPNTGTDADLPAPYVGEIEVAYMKRPYSSFEVRFCRLGRFLGFVDADSNVRRFTHIRDRKRVE